MQSGIAMHTHASVHHGTWVHVQARRAATVRAVYIAHPEQFCGRNSAAAARPLSECLVNGPWGSAAAGSAAAGGMSAVEMNGRGPHDPDV
jgi:hypothetical protein